MSLHDELLALGRTAFDQIAKEMDLIDHIAGPREAQVTRVFELVNAATRRGADWTTNLAAMVADHGRRAHPTLLPALDGPSSKQSVFMSYGHPDETFAARLQNDLTAKGVKTWFFPRDAIPGERLYRAIHEKIRLYDRMILVCSKATLTRSGVLYEVTQVLDRELDEGGSDLVIPVLLEDVFGSGSTPPSWWPDGRHAEYGQLRARINVDFSGAPFTSPRWNEELAKILTALRTRTETV